VDPLADSTIEMVVSKVLDFKILILFRGITTQDVKGRRTGGQIFFKKINFFNSFLKKFIPCRPPPHGRQGRIKKLIFFLKKLYPVARWGATGPIFKIFPIRHIFLIFF